MIAEVAGGRWPDLARTIAVASKHDLEDASASEKLLEDVREIFADREEDRISSARLPRWNYASGTVSLYADIRKRDIGRQS